MTKQYIYNPDKDEFELMEIYSPEEEHNYVIPKHKKILNTVETGRI